jgi:AcrR family transcriptional regulator
MKDNNNDRRVRRTKRLLTKSLTTLMKEKKINKITVSELTELADVNRSTFYLYYKDIYDMVEKIETEMFEDFTTELKKLYLSDSRRDNTLSFFVYVFEFIKENADMCKILLGQDGDYNFLNKFKQAIMECQPPIMHSLGEPEGRYFMPFVISGCIGAIQQWLEDDMKISSTEMSQFLMDLITDGFKPMEAQKNRTPIV